MISKKNKKIIPLLIIDGLSLSVSFLVAYYLRNIGPFRLFLDQVQPLSTYLKSLPFAIVLLFLTFSIFSLYKDFERANMFNELFLSIKAQIVWILLIMSASYLSKYDYSRVIVVLTFFINLFVLSTLRFIYKYFEIKKFNQGRGLQNILIIGAGRPGRDVARRIKDLRKAGYKLVGFVDDNAKNRKNFPVVGKLKDLGQIIKKYKVDEVYFTDARMSYEDILSISSRYFGKNLSFKIATNLFALIANNENIDSLEDIPSLDLWRSSENFIYNIIKRLLDIFISTLLLFITLPLWIVIRILITIEDGLPAIIKVKRVGYKGQTFLMYKFRTMKKTTNRNAKSPRSENDNRITKMGRVLRKTSLDELPQLLNIILGNMSLVGPRPEIPKIVEGYSKWQKLRLEAKPGLTGLWQVLGRKDLPLHENIEYDFYYINNQSLLMDLTIILKTIPIVIWGKGAY
ncbi:sugar transferase [Candidatus Woesebacteria bacterium]|nr:sugar transferase [Candidatus Woesebacteria bacterium]